MLLSSQCDIRKQEVIPSWTRTSSLKNWLEPPESILLWSGPGLSCGCWAMDKLDQEPNIVSLNFLIIVQCIAVQCTGIQYSAVECSAVKFRTVQCSAVQYSAVQYQVVKCHIVFSVLPVLVQKTPIRTQLWLRTVLHCTLLNYTALNCTELNLTALNCTELHCTSMHCTLCTRMSKNW